MKTENYQNTSFNINRNIKVNQFVHYIFQELKSSSGEYGKRRGNISDKKENN